MKRVLVVHPSDELYGADIILLSLIDFLLSKNVLIYVVLPTDMPYAGLLSTELSKRNVKIFYFDIAVLRRKYFSIKGIINYFKKLMCSVLFLKRLINENSINIVFSNTFAVIPGPIVAAFTNRSHIWHIHEIIESPRFMRLLTSILACFLGQQTICVSNAVKNNIIKIYGQRLQSKLSMVRVIHNGIDVNGFATKAHNGVRYSPWEGTKFFVAGVVGRISPFKGQYSFLDTAATISVKCPQARFTFVGSPLPGNDFILDELKARACELRISSKLHIDGFRKDIWNVINSLDVLVLSSVEPDPFPTIILEAMALSKPVVAFAVGGVPEMIEDEVTGFLIAPGRKDLMAEKILMLFDDDELRLKMGRAAKKRALTMFDLPFFYKQWNEFFV